MTAFTLLPPPQALREQLSALLAGWRAERWQESITIEWCPRLRTAAGRADLRARRIRLNPRLLARVPDQVGGVLAHEAAHVVARLRFGARIAPHGAEWASLMRTAGLPPDPCHDFPIEGLVRRKFFYLHLCARCGERLILRQGRSVRCGRCRGRAEILKAKAPQTPRGYGVLAALSVEEARRLEGSSGAGSREIR